MSGLPADIALQSLKVHISCRWTGTRNYTPRNKPRLPAAVVIDVSICSFTRPKGAWIILSQITSCTTQLLPASKQGSFVPSLYGSAPLLASVWHHNEPGQSESSRKLSSLQQYGWPSASLLLMKGLNHRVTWALELELRTYSCGSKNEFFWIQRNIRSVQLIFLKCLCHFLKDLRQLRFSTEPACLYFFPLVFFH